MSAPLVLQQYWQLMRTLMFPQRVTRWLIMGVLVLAILGGLLLWWVEQPVVLIISAVLAFTIIILIGIMVPAQMLSLASSKQLFWIPGLRGKTFLILFFSYSLTALLVSLLPVFNPNAASLIVGVAVAFAFVAIIAALMLMASVYFQGVQPFIFILIWGVYFIAEQLLLVSALISFVLGSLIWIILYLWWTRWIPQKYHLNYMTTSPAKLREAKERQVSIIQSLSYRMSSLPRSLCGTLFGGAPDGFNARLKYELGQVVGVLFMVLIVSYFLRGVPKEGFLKIFPVFLLTFMASRNVQIQLLSYRNLYRIWMFYSGSRTSLFYYVEKQYAQNIGFAYASLVLVTLVINFMLGDQSIPMGLLAFTGAVGILFAAQLFYLSWIVYQKTAASMVLLGWLTGILTALFILLMAFMDLLWGPNSAQHFNDYWLLIGVMLVVLIAVRYWALKVWGKINIYRVKN